MSSDATATDVFTLDRDRFAEGLTEWAATELADDPVETIDVDTFGLPGPGAIVGLLDATRDWGAIRGPENTEVVVYALESEYENPIIIAVRATDFELDQPMSQTATFSQDANRLTSDIWEGTGTDHLAAVVDAILFEANKLLAVHPR